MCQDTMPVKVPVCIAVNVQVPQQGTSDETKTISYLVCFTFHCVEHLLYRYKDEIFIKIAHQVPKTKPLIPNQFRLYSQHTQSVPPWDEAILLPTESDRADEGRWTWWVHGLEYVSNNSLRLIDVSFLLTAALNPSPVMAPGWCFISFAFWVSTPDTRHQLKHWANGNLLSHNADAVVSTAGTTHRDKFQTDR